MLGLVTAAVAAHLDPDLEPLHVAMRERVGAAHVAVVAWDDTAVDWSTFDAVVIRSTWDYTDRLVEFLAWLDRVEAVTTVVNRASVVRWSTDKTYLRDLASEGIAITPTVFVAPGEVAPSVEGLHVVKPTVGAGSSGARRCEPHEVAEHVALLHAEGRTAMVQPYLDLLDEHGETAHCFVAGPDGLWLSHAFRKGAILTSVEVEQEGDLFAKEEITRRVPSAPELALAHAVLSTDVVRSLGPMMFARVDIAPFGGSAADGTDAPSHVVMELELIEPSFYFHVNPGSVEVFADALAAWVAYDAVGDGAAR